MRRRLARSVPEARRLVDAGRVTVAGSPALNPGRLVAAGEPIEVSAASPGFASRGGEKLESALGRFGVDVTGLRVLDAGSSTGGFTDCLLEHGAAEVIAVDVGHGLMHERLVGDARVHLLERTDLRSVTPELLGGRVDLVTLDLSFIGLELVLDAAVGALEGRGEMIALVKPQFEATRAEASRGKGVISDPAVWLRVMHEAIDALSSRGATIMGVMSSPIRGARGNVEFFVHARFGQGPRESSLPPADLEGALEAAVEEAAAFLRVEEK